MYRYFVYTTIFIKGTIYQYLDIYKCKDKVNGDIFRTESLFKYLDEISKYDDYTIAIIRQFKER